MKVLIIASKNSGQFSPFVTEQVNAIKMEAKELQIDYYGIIGHGVSGYLGNFTLLKKKIKDFKPDIIHAHYGLSGLLATLQNKIPVVITFHNGETLSYIANFLSSIGAMRALHVIYVAEHIRKLSCYKSPNYTIQPCGISLADCKLTDYNEARSQLGFAADMKYILFGGAFSNLRKNYPLLKTAINLFPERDKIKCIEMKGLTREECSLLMCGCDLFALPTKSEGSPQALKEAMACNCPIVATDVADIAHLLENLSGCFITSLDPHDFASKLSQALLFNKRTEGRNRIIELGLTNDMVAKKIIKIYNHICNEINIK